MRNVEIGYKNVFAFILEKWPSIAFIVIACALLYAFGSGKISDDSTNDYSRAKSKLSTTQVANVEAAIINDKLLESMIEQYEEVESMYSKATWSLNLNCTVGEVDGLSPESIIALYKTCLAGDELLSYVSAECDISKEEVMGHFYVSYGETNELGDSEFYAFSENSGITPNSFTIIVFADTKQSVLDFSESIKNYLNDTVNKIVTLDGAHKLIISEGELSSEKNRSLIDSCVRLGNAISLIAYRGKTIKDNFTSNERTYYNAAITYGDESALSRTDSNNSAEESVIKFSLQKFMIGGISGFLVALIFWLIVYIWKNRVEADEDLQACYSVPSFGYIQKEDKLTFYERVLGICKKNMSREDSIKLLIARTVSTLEKAGIRRLAIVSSSCDKGVKELEDTVKQLLVDRDIHVDIIDGAITEASFEIIKNAGSAIIIEKARVSKRNEIYNEIELIKQSNSKICGAVLVG